LKIVFLIPLVLLFVASPVYGQLLSDATGLVNRLNVQTGGHAFEIKVTSNFDISDFNFDKNSKQLSLYLNSGLENNLGEILIPQSLLGGNFTFYLNDQEFFPTINSNEKITFVTLNFTGSGNNKLDIFGTTYLDGLTEIEEIPLEKSTPLQKEETMPDTIGLLLLIGIPIVIAAFVIMKIKKRK